MNTNTPNTTPGWTCRGLLGLAALCLALATQVCWGATLVNLDATQLPEGPLATWDNTGTLEGDFTSAGTTVPQVVKAKAGKGLQFISTAHYIGPVPPTTVTGNGSRTVEAWVYDTTQQPEETVFAWGRRGADGINCSFGHGTGALFGAVGHWGGADIGWSQTEGENITYNEWTYIVYTYDGPSQTTTVYHNGAYANTETLGTPLNTAAVDTSGAPLHFRVARQNNGNGAVSTTGVGDIIIGRIRVHDVALSDADVFAKYNAEVDDFIERDTDGDLMPDWWEALYPAFLNPNDNADAALDQDADGLSNVGEYQNKTLPDNPDTDADGAKDGAEVDRTDGGSPAPTDPLKPDTDGDGLRDGVETDTGDYQSPQDTGTDPLAIDTDLDTYADWQEILEGSDPTDALSTPEKGVMLVLLDATKLPAGPLPVWANTGVFPGDFNARDSQEPPQVTTILGVNGVRFDGSDFYTGPIAPIWMTGNGAHTVEAWVYNPSLATEETVFAWGRRGVGDGSNCSFNHGTDPAYGAVGHWGAPDIGWDGKYDAGTWTHIAYTWDPTSTWQNVYHNGQPANSESLPDGLSIHATDTSGNPLPFRVATQSNDNGGPNTDLEGSMTIAKIAVYDYALDDATILQHYTADAKAFGLTDDDNDGMPTIYELLYPAFLDPNDNTDAAKDQDNDGLTNLEEYQNGTQPDNPDTDDDGLSDGTEIKTTFTRALVSDTDEDGLNDSQEGTAGTDPLNPDFDGDSYADGLEVARGSDPKSYDSSPSFDQPVAIIDVDASALDLGQLPYWPNNGAMKGRFKAGTPTPTVEVVAGVKAVTLNGTNYYSGPVSPTWMVGNSARTVEAWVYNPVIPDEETVFSWGRRGGDDGSNCAFNHGLNGTYGAVGHWGAADVGWNGTISASQWNHIAYTYDPGTYLAIVYSGGQAANTNDIYTTLAGEGLNTHGVNDTPEPDALPLTFLIAAQHDSNGAVTEGLRGALSIARIRVYDQALSAEAIAQIYSAEVAKYTAIAIDSITYNADADTLIVTWNTTVAGAKYDVLATSILGTAWTPVATGIPEGTYTDHPSVAGPRRYYKIRLQ